VSKSGDNLKKANIHAVTIVAACKSALNGVGPSIAYGSNPCKPSCADFDITPKKIKKKMLKLKQSAK